MVGNLFLKHTCYRLKPFQVNFDRSNPKITLQLGQTHIERPPET